MRLYEFLFKKSQKKRKMDKKCKMHPNILKIIHSNDSDNRCIPDNMQNLWHLLKFKSCFSVPLCISHMTAKRIHVDVLMNFYYNTLNKRNKKYHSEPQTNY